MAATTITVLSQKGGTGKTTTVRTLADVLRRIGLEVLVVDLDPQGNLSDYYDVPPDTNPTIADVLAGQVAAIDAIYDGVILPANLGLAEAELILAGKMGRELTLRRALREPKRRYDVVVIDCPPALGLLTINALVAADFALITSEAEYFSLQGVEQALEVIELAKDNLHDELEWLGVVLNIVDLRLIHAREAREQLRERFDGKVFDAVIRKSVRYAESAERGVSILDYGPDLGADYIDLSDELLERIGMGAERRRLEALRAELEPEPADEPVEEEPEEAPPDPDGGAAPPDPDGGAAAQDPGGGAAARDPDEGAAAPKPEADGARPDAPDPPSPVAPPSPAPVEAERPTEAERL